MPDQLAAEVKDWFRPPKLYEMCRRGDCRRLLLVAEPERGKGVYGVGYEVTDMALELEPTMESDLLKAAEKELQRRIENKDFHPEGSLWEVFEWRPVFTKRVVIED